MNSFLDSFWLYLVTGDTFSGFGDFSIDMLLDVWVFFISNFGVFSFAPISVLSLPELTYLTDLSIKLWGPSIAEAEYSSPSGSV